MKTLVTGGAGFIGSTIVDALIAEGHEVLIVDNLSSGRRENVNPSARFVDIDIRDRGIASLFKSEKPVTVFHYAGQIDVRRSISEPLFDCDVNLKGLLNILTSAAENSCKKFIFASSGGAIYGDVAELPATEDSPVSPISPYGVAKAAGELYLQCFQRMSGLDYVALRYSNVYGPRQDPIGEAGVVAIFTHTMLHGIEPEIFGDGKQTRDFVYVDDVAAANLKALAASGSGVYNIASGTELSINNLFAVIAGLTGYHGKVSHAAPRPGEIQRTYLDCSRALTDMSWKPSVSIEEGLARTVGYFKGKPR